MTEPDIDTAASALLAAITEAGGLIWVPSLQAYYLKGSIVPEKHLVKHLWQRGKLRAEGHDLIAETSP